MTADDRKITAAEFQTLIGPIFERVVATRGKPEAMRLFRVAVVAAGLDPNEVRVIDTAEVPS